MYCGNNRRGNATCKELKSVVRPSEGQSPSTWRGKAWLGDLRTSRHVGLWAHWELEPWQCWLKTYNKYMLSAETINYPRDHPVPPRQRWQLPLCTCPCHPTRATSAWFHRGSTESRRLLTCTGWRTSVCPWKLPKCFKGAWRVLDKAPSVWACEVWWAHVLPCSHITRAIHHNAYK